MGKIRKVYRDGIEHFSLGEIIDTPEAIVEVLYSDEKQKEVVYFAELKGTVYCSHGETIEEAILEARAKGGLYKITDEEKRVYSSSDYKFNVAVFRRLTGACRVGINTWLEERGLSKDVKMTLSEFRKMGGGQWADRLEASIK